MRCHDNDERFPICRMGFDEELVYRAPERKRFVTGQDADRRAQGQLCVHCEGRGRGVRVDVS